MSELLACPFCGGEAHVLKEGLPYVVIECVRCFGRTNCNVTEAEAIAAWNSRAERTCHIEGSYYDELMDEHYTQLSCDHETSEYKPNYCPTCGARVVGGDDE